MPEPTQPAAIPPQAITAAEPHPEGNPALAAAVQAILGRRLAASHGTGDDASRRAALLLEILPDAAAALAAAGPYLAAAERAKLYAELGGDHHVIFTEDGWTVEHSVECRLSGHMHECAYHTAVAHIAGEYEPAMAGRWKITCIDSEGMPGFEWAESQP